MPEEIKDDMTPDQIYELEDVTVETLGLVEAGAVGEDFFLLKNEEGAMPDESTTIDEVLNERGFLEKLGVQRLLDLIAKGQAAETEQDEPGSEDLDKADKDKMKKKLSAGAARSVRALIDQYGDDLPANVAGMLRGLLGDSDDDMEYGQGTKTEKNNNHNEVNKMKDDEKVTQPVNADIQPAKETQPEEPVTKSEAVEKEDILTRLEKAEATNALIMARLEKSEAELKKAQLEAAQERNAREVISHIDKAREFDGLGVDPDQMGRFLFELAKADETANLEKSADAEDRSNLVEYITSILKAANEQIKQAGFFAEAGTAKIPEEMGLIEKARQAVEAGKYTDIREALMNISRKDASEYLEKFNN